jgi:DNA polymerase I-like protein with 3'-5' exonuclease and polymerase domains
LASRSGKISLEDIDFYKWASKDGAQLNANTMSNLKHIKKVRQDYKKTNYSATYGIGAEKLARDLKSTKQVAKQLLNDFWDRNAAVRKVADACEVKVVKGTKWLYNPVSKFWYTLRKEHDRFSTLNQSTGVYCFDKWIAHTRKKRPQLTAQFHDETIYQVKKGNRERMSKLLLEAIDKVNEEVKLNVRLSIDIKYGDNYAAIH